MIQRVLTFLSLGLRLLPFGLTLVCVLWMVKQSPFAAPLVERTSDQIEARLTRAMARDVDLAWLLPRVQDAIIQEDLIQMDVLVGLANDHGVVLPRTMVEDMIGIDAATHGLFARGIRCGACAVDITGCDSLAQIGACALPFELTPAGDVNALRRAGVDYVAGETIDRLDVGLALVGLGATGAVIATGGSSYTIKAGTSVLRMARRLGTLSPALSARLTGLMGDAVKWDRLGDLAALRIGPADMVNSAKLGELTEIGGSLRRVADNTSVAEAVSLVRHVDNAQEAAQLARVTDALGPKTRGAFEVLGKSRVLRATARLSDLALGAGVAIYALVMQILVFGAQQCGNICLRSVGRAAGGRRA
ncbi:hypothetical protein Q4555_14015 [Octadecabacter sp. 1_MG-2023]|uniref:hypothetical protein n=1 Tax=unclassified Octadecabacter TaxID=196158 RepID=UPI001C08C403|nr:MULTISPECIES: hypothetical protein [unclassified Octadecabacter]MBU2991815.1 hypothetical protein [Octadecabacter sp. B2R22]MDO6735789.1 hypothetical protein [Octadecabacter sp. 1_MG-2023]